MSSFTRGNNILTANIQRKYSTNVVHSNYYTTAKHLRLNLTNRKCESSVYKSPKLCNSMRILFVLAYVQAESKQTLCACAVRQSPR